ncbi:MAG: CoA pyrophosphatase [Saprospiraceae bacterium]|nr:CoA pyrophosphatase [Saprospiraceae bacterium]
MVAQRAMVPHAGRLNPSIPRHPKEAAILILLFPSEGQIQTVFISRARHDSDVHSGQISFPGGQLESGDADHEACARRETHEEIGVKIPKKHLIGRLSPLYIPVSNFLVTPIMASIPYTPQFIPERKEVQSIVPTPLAHLLDVNTMAVKDMTISSGQKVPNVPFYQVDEHKIWGATAMILSECLYLMREL